MNLTPPNKKWKSSAEYLEWVRTLSKSQFRYVQGSMVQTLEKLRKKEFERESKRSKCL